MSWRDEITLKLPSPHEEEPRDLRREILDEIEDHLECAMQREMRHVDDANTARRRVLKRFGSPGRLARRLWFDSMKGHLMNQRIMLGTNITMLVLVLAMFIVVLFMLRQHQHFQQHMLDRLAALTGEPTSQQPESSTAWPRASVHLQGHSDHPITVAFSGRLYQHEQNTQVSRQLEDGRADFGPVMPGRHTLTVTGPNHEQLTKQVVLPPGRDHETELRWPDPDEELVPVSITHNLDAVLREHDPIVVLTISRYVVDGENEWRWLWEYAVLDAHGHVAIMDREVFERHVTELGRYGTTSTLVDVNGIPFAEQVEIDATMRHEVSLQGIFVPTEESLHGDKDEYHRVPLITRRIQNRIFVSNERELVFGTGAQPGEQWLIEFSDEFLEMLRSRPTFRDSRSEDDRARGAEAV